MSPGYNKLQRRSEFLQQCTVKTHQREVGSFYLYFFIFLTCAVMFLSIEFPVRTWIIFFVRCLFAFETCCAWYFCERKWKDQFFRFVMFDCPIFTSISLQVIPFFPAKNKSAWVLYPRFHLGFYPFCFGGWCHCKVVLQIFIASRCPLQMLNQHDLVSFVQFVIITAMESKSFTDHVSVIWILHILR